MRPRPRCRSWIPLSTQQLRLRNLIGIQGLNIRCYMAGALIYYTLHHSYDAPAFYVSEYLPHRQEQKWAEIVCPELLNSNARCVCVRVWARPLGSILDPELFSQTAKTSEVLDPLSALSRELSNTYRNACKESGPQDNLLFTWGLYFSGLTPLSQQMDFKCKDNSLIFLINGEYFASAEYLISDNLEKMESLNDQPYSANVSKYNIHKMDSQYALKTKYVINTTESCGLVDIHPNFAKARYFQLYVDHSDVRKSYILHQLLQIQEKQRKKLQTNRESKDFETEIQRRSVYCITKEQLCKPQMTLFSSCFTKYQQRATMGRALSVLFSEQQQINPQSLLCAQKIQKQLEALRFKQRLLQSEYHTNSSRIAQQRHRLHALIEVRQLRQSWLRSRQQQLQGEKKQLAEHDQKQNALKQRKSEIMRNMERRMSELCVELREVYPIERNAQGLNTINKVPFPSMEAYINDAKYASGVNSAGNVLPITLSVSLGYIAHLVQMIGVIIDRPLRNPIIHQGSRSRIMDIIKETSIACPEFPLYSRSNIPSKSVKYAIILLNQNIAQLCYDITGVRCDLGATLENIQQIFTYLAEIQQNECLDETEHKTSNMYQNKLVSLHFNNNKNTVNGCENFADSLSKSHSSVDMNHIPIPIANATPMNSLLQLPRSHPFSIADTNMTQQRVCRSVGSYSDSEDHFTDIRGHGYSNSDSNITTRTSHI